MGSSSLASTEFVAFDLETTGLSPLVDGIVEIGAVRFLADGTVCGTFSQLIDPRRPIPIRAQEIHGITESMVRGQPTLADVLPEFLAFLGTRDTTVLLAHNAPFDLGFLSLAFSLQELPLPGQPVFDSCDLSRRRLRLPRYSLEVIGRSFGLIETEAHRGLDDSLLLKEVFVRLLAEPPALRSLEALEATSRSLRFQDFSRTLAPDPPGFPGLRKAIAARHMLEIRYRGGSQPGIPRRILPLQVVETRSELYLTAICQLNGQQKSFRLDRIEQIWILQ